MLEKEQVLAIVRILNDAGIKVDIDVIDTLLPELRKVFIKSLPERVEETDEKDEEHEPVDDNQP